MNSRMLNYLCRLPSTDTIPAERLHELNKLREYINTSQTIGKEVSVLVVCTHNSRRSQLWQSWAHFWSYHFGKSEFVKIHSAGTEQTEVHQNVFQTLLKTGFDIVGNKGYHELHLANGMPSAKLFSKTFEHSSIPKKDFATLTVCDHANENCPFVPGSETRIHLNYNDPKFSDPNL